jgi:hypothetical protein
MHYVSWQTSVFWGRSSQPEQNPGGWEVGNLCLALYVVAVTGCRDHRSPVDGHTGVSNGGQAVFKMKAMGHDRHGDWSILMVMLFDSATQIYLYGERHHKHHCHRAQQCSAERNHCIIPPTPHCSPMPWDAVQWSLTAVGTLQYVCFHSFTSHWSPGDENITFLLCISINEPPHQVL